MTNIVQHIALKGNLRQDLPAPPPPSDSLQCESAAPTMPKLDRAALIDATAAAINSGGNFEEIALQLARSGQRLDQNFALALIERGASRFVAATLEQFIECNHKYIARELIDRSESLQVAQHLEHFRNLDQEIAEALVHAKHGKLVASQISHFGDLDFSTVANLLADTGQAQAVAENMARFRELSPAVALKLVASGFGYAVSQHLHQFTRLNQNVALALVGAGRGTAVCQNLDKFEPLDQRVLATALIAAGESVAVADNIERFTRVDHNLLAQKMIAAGEANRVAASGAFRNLDQDTALQLIQAGWGKDLNLACFNGLESKVAYALVAAGNIHIVDHLDIFHLENREPLALKLIEAGQGWAVASNVHAFPDLSPESICTALKKAGNWPAIGAHIDRMGAIDHNEVAQQLIEKKDFDVLLMLARSSQGLDQRVAVALLQNRPFASILPYLDRFNGIDAAWVAGGRKNDPEGFFAVAEQLSGAETLKPDCTGKERRPSEQQQRLLAEVAAKLAGPHSDQESLTQALVQAGLRMLAARKLGESEKQIGDLAEAEKRAAQFGERALIASAKTLGLSLVDALFCEQVFRGGSAHSEEAYKKAYELLRTTRRWQELHELLPVFEHTAQRFGYRETLRFISSRTDVPHSVAFRALESLVRIFDRLNSPHVYSRPCKQLADKAFINLLRQVQKDHAIHPSGTSYHEVIQRDSRIAMPRELQQVCSTKGQILMPACETPSSILSSWRALSHFLYRANFAHWQSDIYKAVQEFTRAGKHRLVAYVLQIAPRVSTLALTNFVSRPDEFFDAGDKDADRPDWLKLQDIKKPSNYFRLPGLDLTGVELRDALVEGALDRVQVLPPFEVRYKVPKPGTLLPEQIRYMPIRTLIYQVLGRSGDENNPGMLTRRARLKLYHLLNQNLKEGEHMPSLRLKEDFLDGKVRISGRTEFRLRDTIESVVSAHGLLDLHGQKFIAAVHRRSDPEEAFIGDDVAVCMPAGAGKKNVYQCTPSWAQFSLREADIDWNPGRAVADSIITINLDAKRPFPEIKEALEGKRDFQEVVSEEVLNDRRRVLACDSVDMNENFKAKEGALNLTRMIYEDFFTRYYSALPERLAGGRWIDKSVLHVGAGFPGPFVNHQTVPNTLLPDALTSYWDNRHPNVHLVPLSAHSDAAAFIAEGPEVIFPDAPAPAAGVSPLGYDQAYRASYVKCHAFCKTSEIVPTIHDLQNWLNAKEIVNSHRNNCDLSLQYTDAKGRLQAYVLAVEGIGREKNERIVYIASAAARRRNSVEAGKLLLAFLKNYKSQYLDKADYVPIVFESEGWMGKRLLLRQLGAIELKLGCPLKVIEERVIDEGKATRERIRIVPCP